MKVTAPLTLSFPFSIRTSPAMTLPASERLALMVANPPAPLWLQSVGLGQPRLPVGDAGGGRLLEELREGQAVGGQVEEEVAGEDDELSPDDDRSAGPVVGGVVESDPLDFPE